MNILIKSVVASFLFLFMLTVNAAPDPQKVMGPDECGECHKEEIKAWKKTHHSKTFKKMHRTKEAKSIKKKMGFKRIKRESDCLNCHYTSIPKGKRIKPIAGISCESCHTPAKDWMDIHNDFGGKDVKREDETPEHRKERRVKMNAAGMIGPGNIYALASNCFQCHTVPNEKLVNTGGHEAGSEFELVAWSQGEVRHNYLRSKSGKENIESSQERKRLLYVVGRAVDLEYSLRGMAKAKKPGKYSDSMAARVKAAVAELEKINNAKSMPEVASMITTGKGAGLKPGNEAALLKSADSVASATKKFVSSHDGKGLAAIDGLLPTEYKGESSR
jgi:hypothetical protein